MVRKSSSDFASSRVRASTLSNSRTFSIAIAAWSANVVTSSICLSVNGALPSASSPGRRSGRPRAALGRQNCAVVAQSLALRRMLFRISLYVGNMNHPAFK